MLKHAMMIGALAAVAAWGYGGPDCPRGDAYPSYAKSSQCGCPHASRYDREERYERYARHKKSCGEGREYREHREYGRSFYRYRGDEGYKGHSRYKGCKDHRHYAKKGCRHSRHYGEKGYGEYRHMGKKPCDRGYGAMGGKKGYKGKGSQHFSFEKKRKSHIQRLLKTLYRNGNLTPEQKQKIREIMQEYRQSLAQMRAQAKQGRPAAQGKARMMGLQAFLKDGNFDKEAFVSMIQSRWARQDAMRQKRLEISAETLEKIFALLTPEQRRALLSQAQSPKKPLRSE